MDIRVVERDWAARGFSCDTWTDPPGQTWRDYTHDTDELLMLIDGEIEIHLGGKALYPTIGEEIFIPAHAPHTVINTGATTNRWLYGYQQIGDRFIFPCKKGGRA
ncbi:MAG: cupin domain-containing protein [Gammaproteobacteria bacterium]|nr:cupin domain-containing protein [Gammaproteobacteria bacterium]